MNFSRKTKISSDIPTASMPDIIFMLLIFFMVTTVLREYSGLPISLPKAKRIEKLKSKRHTSHIWVSKEGFFDLQTDDIPDFGLSAEQREIRTILLPQKEQR